MIPTSIANAVMRCGEADPSGFPAAEADGDGERTYDAGVTVALHNLDGNEVAGQTRCYFISLSASAKIRSNVGMITSRLL